MACGLGTYLITMVIYFGIGVDLCNDLNVVRCRSKHSKDAAYSPNNLEELFPTSPLVLLALRSVAFLVKQNVYIDTCIHIYLPPTWICRHTSLLLRIITDWASLFAFA